MQTNLYASSKPLITLANVYNFKTREIPLNLKLNLSNLITPDSEFVYIIIFTTQETVWLNIFGFVYILRSKTAETYKGTHTLSASLGRFLGTWVRPRWEQSTVSPEQEHAHGHLVSSVTPPCPCRMMGCPPILGELPMSLPEAHTAANNPSRHTVTSFIVAHTNTPRLHSALHTARSPRAREWGYVHVWTCATTRLAVHRPTVDWLLRRERRRGETDSVNSSEAAC